MAHKVLASATDASIASASAATSSARAVTKSSAINNFSNEDSSANNNYGGNAKNLIQSEASLLGATTISNSTGGVGIKQHQSLIAAAKLTATKNIVASTTPASRVSLTPNSSPGTSKAILGRGRISDLESVDFGNEIEEESDGSVTEDAKATHKEVQFLESLGEMKSILREGSGGQTTKALDLCCGQGRRTLLLSKKYPGVHWYGHDQSARLISLAEHEQKQHGRQAGANVVFTAGATTQLQLPHADATFDAVLLLGNALGRAGDDGAVFLHEVARVLRPGGRVVVDAADGAAARAALALDKQSHTWQWIDDAYFVCRERQLSADGKRLTVRELRTSASSNSTGAVVRDQFYRLRLYARDELVAVLREAGLDVVNPNEDSAIETNPLDLHWGISVPRIIVTAFKNPDKFPPTVHAALRSAKDLQHPKSLFDNLHATESAAVPKKTHKDDLFESLVVILGDPSQPCVGKLNNTWNAEDFNTREKLVNALVELGYSTETNLSVLDSHESLHESLKRLTKKKQHFIFNLCDEGFDNEALKELHVPAILEMIRLPYSGAGPNCLAYCYDKGLVNRTADALGVPTPRETFFLSDVGTPAVATLAKLDNVIQEQIKYPAFIKPIKGDNSLGITPRSIVHNARELESYMSELHSIGIRDVVVQEYCQGTEYGVGMIGNLATGFHFFPVLEVDYTKIVARNLAPILGFESKWDPASPYWSDISYKPATITDKVKADLHAWCIVLWERFGCRDYARFDFRSDYGRGDGFEKPSERKGTIKLLEVNPNPGWCWDGKFSYMGKFEGLDYKDVLGLILKAARDRTTLDEKKEAAMSSQQQQ
ncbi:hypothetical protein HK100_011324 [Physocladia obscura]|uniref:ATP-grasp domain-containing protein n=1 Tax=Physocladia obscura TaxID=109957 RepID=A0AAD5XDA8_9FUNG|nr:hypothetical protein HK100_011324 [Physocladia obscura]